MKITILPNEIIDNIISYISDIYQINPHSDSHVSLICKDFLMHTYTELNI